jgi:hypothetical protein
MPPYTWTYVYKCDTCNTEHTITLDEARWNDAQKTGGVADSRSCVIPACRGVMKRTDLSSNISESFPPDWKLDLTVEQRQAIIEKREGVFRTANALVNDCFLNLPPNQHIDHVIRVADWLLQLPKTQE